MTSGACWSTCCQRGRRREAAEVDEAAAHRRDPVAGPGRGAMAGRPAGVRTVAVGLRPVPPLAARRHLGLHHRGAAGPGRRGRARDLGRFRGLGHCPGPPARRGARKDGAAQKEPPGGAGGPEPGDHALGRSRGGLTSKFHLAVEQGQKPLAVIVTAGQRGDSPQFIPVLEKISVPRPGGDSPGPGGTGSWPTRPMAARPTAPGCAAAGSPAPSPRRKTRSRTGRRRAPQEDAGPPRPGEIQTAPRRGDEQATVLS